MEWFRNRPGLVRVLAVVVPLAAAGGLHLALAYVTNSVAALLLVLCVVAAAATGDRIAGLLAGLACAVGFDFFLTRPYLRLSIDNPEDLELAALLLIVGLCVSELASWGIRQSAAANEQAGFVQGALESADLAFGSTGQAEALERVAEAIRRTLDAEKVQFEDGEHPAGAAVIDHDGTVRVRGRTLTIPPTGLPGGRYPETVIPIARHGAAVGYFAVSSPNRVTHPSREQLRVAVLLASQWSLRVDDTAAARQRRRSRLGTDPGGAAE